MRNNQQLINRIATIISFAVIIGGVLLIIYLGRLTAENNAIITEYQHNNNENPTVSHDDSTELAQEQISEESSDPDEELNSNHAIPNQAPQIKEDNFLALLENVDIEQDSPADLSDSIQDILQTRYNNDLLDAQKDIVQAIESENLNPETMGDYFLPTKPAEYTNDNDDQLNVPLYLQNSPQWGELHYGSNGSQSLAENGCAIVSLAMMDSYLSNKKIDPKDVLDWAGQDYYVDNEGTSWQIFHEYAVDHGLTFENHGNDFHSAITALQNDQIVIASVEPGYFTEVGHILVIRGYKDGNVYVNDPNDDPEKMYSIQAIPEQVFLEEGVNYWSYSK
ncbi:C39 family peptidase [Facklamia sp. DSM 111018]|uniref:C39 family peptidase n=1 Tax=Facklamia lactis TaxID=2749967 RepID=A0ABS0LT62_9LACT|nr:C39 family peptidase [Facklamia lactis]MBG9981320.1 C39 family peptidase [Facklamia lactis]MBG9987204.1 C39 family peptidase [Facklamia lactis]